MRRCADYPCDACEIDFASYLLYIPLHENVLSTNPPPVSRIVLCESALLEQIVSGLVWAGNGCERLICRFLGSSLNPNRCMHLATFHAEHPAQAATSYTLLAAFAGASWHWLRESRVVEHALEVGFHQVVLKAKATTATLEIGLDFWRSLHYFCLAFGGTFLEEAWRRGKSCLPRRRDQAA